MVTVQQEDIVMAKHGLCQLLVKIDFMKEETFLELCSELDYRFTGDRDEQALIQKFVADYRVLSERD